MGRKAEKSPRVVKQVAQTAQTARTKGTAKKPSAKQVPTPTDAETVIPPGHYHGSGLTIPDAIRRGELTQGRDITAAFTELIQEAKACTYTLLNRMVNLTGERKWPHGSWKPFTKERDALLKRFKKNNPPGKYGDTLRRASLVPELIVPHLLTDEQARAQDERRGMVGTRDPEGLLIVSARIFENAPDAVTKDGLRRFRADHCGMPDLADADLLAYYATHPMPRWYRCGVDWHSDRRHIERGDMVPTFDAVPYIGTDGTVPPGAYIGWKGGDIGTDVQLAQWREEFVAEVVECADRFAADDRLGQELDRLIRELDRFKVGQGAAAEFIERLGGDTDGVEALAALENNKHPLLTRLKEVREEYAPAEASTPAEGRITWLGSQADLSAIFRDLVDGRWIRLDGTWPKFADKVWAVFQNEKGVPFDKNTLRQYLKPSGNIPKKAGSAFNIGERRKPT